MQKIWQVAAGGLRALFRPAVFGFGGTEGAVGAGGEVVFFAWASDDETLGYCDRPRDVGTENFGSVRLNCWCRFVACASPPRKKPVKIV